MPMTEHVGWLTFPRPILVRDWSDLLEQERRVLQDTAAREAEAVGGSVPAQPVAGWVSRAHSRDGKSHVCREQTNGARPAWVWKVTK